MVRLYNIIIPTLLILNIIFNFVNRILTTGSI